MLVDKADKDIIINLIESLNPNQFKGLTTKIKYLYPNIFSNLKNIQKNKNIKTFSEVLYLIINDMDDIPQCCGISNKCNHLLKFKSIIYGYHPYCKYCSSLTEDFKIKREETNLDKYGTKYPTQNKFILEKINDTIYKKYGVRNAKQIKKDLKNGK